MLRALPPKSRMTPIGGWICAIREALGMSQADLARRMQVRTSSVAKLERSERAGSVQLNSLRRAAEALDCQVICVLVPRRSLQDLVDERRTQLFSQMWGNVEVHARLSGLGLDDPGSGPGLLRVAEAVVPDSVLWRDDIPSA